MSRDQLDGALACGGDAHHRVRRKCAVRYEVGARLPVRPYTTSINNSGNYDDTTLLRALYDRKLFRER